MKKMTRFGVGPVIAPLGFGFLGITILFHYLFRPLFSISGNEMPTLRTAGWITLAAGILLLLSCGAMVTRAFSEHKLITGWAFRVFLNPMYAAFCLLIVPGIALILNSWLVLTTSLFFYVVYRTITRKEDDYLLKEFGEEYLNYRKKVLFPFF